MKLLFALFAAFTAGCTALRPDPNEPVPVPTIAHQILSIEEAVGVPPVARERLDAFLAACEARIERRACTSHREARNVLTEIGAILREQGYTFSSDGIALLSQALEQKVLDCDTASYLYLAAGERMEFPIRGVMAPCHFFVRWHGAYVVLGWETTTNLEAFNSDFVMTFGIHPDAVRNGVYLRSLARSDVLAISAALVGSVLGAAKRHDEAIRCYDVAVASLPTLAFAYTNRARCYREKCQVERAHQDLNCALALDPNSSHAHAFRAVLCMDEEKFEQGIAAATAAIQLRPFDASLYALRAAVYKLRSAKTNSLQDLIKASEDEELARTFSQPRPSFIPFPW